MLSVERVLLKVAWICSLVGLVVLMMQTDQERGTDAGKVKWVKHTPTVTILQTSESGGEIAVKKNEKIRWEMKVDIVK